MIVSNELFTVNSLIMDVPSTQSLICPGCAESNDSAMLFCIFCGADLQSFLASAPSGESMAGAAVAQALPVQPPGNQSLPDKPVKNETAALLCGSCGRTDLLNAQFCVFCGGKIIANVAVSRGDAGAGRAAPPSAGMAPLFIPDKKSSSSLSHNSTSVLILVAVIVFGSVSGFSLTRLFAQQITSNLARQKIWPTSGMVMYVDKANTPFILHDEQQKQFVIGLIGAAGSLSLQSIDPGTYYLSFGKESLADNRQPLEVKAGEVSVLGFPSRLMIDENRGGL